MDHDTHGWDGLHDRVHEPLPFLVRLTGEGKGVHDVDEGNRVHLGLHGERAVAEEQIGGTDGFLEEG